MCGIVGILGRKSVNQDVYDALTILQHRGQDAAGIMTCQDNKVFMRKGNGLVRDVIAAQHMLLLKGNMGVGHVRYPTAGSASVAEAQPFYVNSPYGLAIVHNGNLINAAALSQELVSKDLRHLNTGSDSELILNVFAGELQRLNGHGEGVARPTKEDIFTAVRAVHKRCLGAYAVAIMVIGHGMVAFRDPYGIRPLVMGQRKTDQGVEHLFASESIALDALGYHLDGDVFPGEAVYVDMKTGARHREQCADEVASGYSPCIFEYVYLARPDSIIDEISVYQARLRMGEKLADHILKVFPDHDIDVVVPIPETSRTAALPLALRLGVAYREGFVKNRYVGRTFIMPGQEKRKKSIKQKLNAIEMEFKNKCVLLVDDSIVRGNTSKEVIQIAREAGARKVYFASVSPMIHYPNVYGIDMPAAAELVANQGEDVAALIGADWVVYQEMDALYEAVREANPKIERFEDCVFTGDYVTGDVDAGYLAELELQRSDQNKSKEAAQQFLSDTGQIVEIYNH